MSLTPCNNTLQESCLECEEGGPQRGLASSPSQEWSVCVYTPYSIFKERRTRRPSNLYREDTESISPLSLPRRHWIPDAGPVISFSRQTRILPQARWLVNPLGAALKPPTFQGFGSYGLTREGARTIADEFPFVNNYFSPAYPAQIHAPNATNTITKSN
jgi:hypothetical protein